MSELTEMARSFPRIFWPTEGNSQREKLIFYVVLALFTVAAFGKVTATFTPDPTLWKILLAAILIQGSHIWGRESERIINENINNE